LQQGLQAIKKGEGRGKIKADDQSKVLGSVCLDEDCKKAEPNASRWDYAVGYYRNEASHVFYIEEHAADTHAVREMDRKFQWLKDFLNRESSNELSRLTREYHWLQHAGFHIRKHDPQYKLLLRLQRGGIKGPVPSVTLS